MIQGLLTTVGDVFARFAARNQPRKLRARLVGADGAGLATRKVRASPGSRSLLVDFGAESRFARAVVVEAQGSAGWREVARTAATGDRKYQIQLGEAETP